MASAVNSHTLKEGGGVNNWHSSSVQPDRITPTHVKRTTKISDGSFQKYREARYISTAKIAYSIR
jgi:hypothetical protein